MLSGDSYEKSRLFKISPNLAKISTEIKDALASWGLAWKYAPENCHHRSISYRGNRDQQVKVLSIAMAVMRHCKSGQQRTATAAIAVGGSAAMAAVHCSVGESSDDLYV